MAATNSVIAQTGKNFEGFGNVDWTLVGENAIVGGFSGAASGAAGYWASSATLNVNGFAVKSPLLRSAIVSPIAAGAGHVAGGTVGGLLEGKSLGDSFANSFAGIGTSMAMGEVIGVTSTVAACYAEGISPWTGIPLSQGGNYTVYQGIDPETKEVKYVGITKRDPQVRWNEHYNSGTNRDALDYFSVERGLTQRQARIMEQQLINKYGIIKLGGQLYNKINSIAPKNWEKFGIVVDN